ncbi:MAG TPA: ABC transporter permease [Pyrinomonadaceae bacterium]|nr:ABC transporter permease [Pyrinomonadaceae bacterium]
MNALWLDIRYGARTLWKSPGFTLVAVLALALGIGANSAIYSVVNAVLLRALPYENPDRLVMLWEQHPQAGRMGAAAANFVEWRKAATSFDGMTIFAQSSFDLAGEGEAERIEGTRASASFFEVIGGRAAVGRTFREGDDAPGAERIAILGHGLWQRRFGGDPAVLGKSIQLNDEPHTVVGVMPQRFGDTPPDFVWTPLQPAPDGTIGGGRSLLAVARLKPGVAPEAAQAEIEAIAARLAESRPDFNRDWTVRVVPLHEQVTGGVRLTLLVLFGAVGFVLLIACANVANLSLVRATRRERELAIRTALGASRWRIMRQLLTESLLLALAGGALGLLVALWGVDLLLTLAPDAIPRADEVGVDTSVLTFTLVVSILTGLACGLAPAVQGTRADVSTALKDAVKGSAAGFGRSRLRGALVVAEVALAVVLLTGAGLLMRSFARLTQVNPGFDAAAGVVLMDVPLSPARYREEAQVVAFYDELLRRVRQLPGVESAGTTHTAPLSGGDSARPFVVADAPPPEPGKEPGASYRVISPGYFRSMGIPVLRGRDFADSDNSSAPPVVVVNETLARRSWPGRDPLGQRMRQGAVGGDSPWMEVVGVVGDVRHAALDSEPKPEMYFTFRQAGLQRSSSIANNSRRITLAVRGAGDTAALARAARAEVAGIDKNQPVAGVRTLGDAVSRSVTPQRFNTLLLGVFAALAVALAMIGVYGVMSFSVGGRTREIGIRMALGAQRRDVVGMILRQGMALVAVGVALGLAASAALTRWMTTMLYGVSATDPLVFAAVTALLIAAALVACYVPARRATKISPMEALRYE